MRVSEKGGKSGGGGKLPDATAEVRGRARTQVAVARRIVVELMDEIRIYKGRLRWVRGAEAREREVGRRLAWSRREPPRPNDQVFKKG